MPTLKEKALKIAISQLGQHENPLGSNWGTPVKEYLASVGINFPAAWCAAFVYWCFKQANTNVPLVKTAGVLNHWNTADKKYRVTDPQPGDIFIMDYGKGLGHTGFVEKVDATFIYTVEGNSNDSGSREGIEVTRKQRPRTKIKGYLRYV
jgi:uncharacterized protein (TIGR02594 family)